MNRARFWLRVVILTTVAWLLVNGWAFEVARVRSISMLPTLRPGQFVAVNRLAYGVRWMWSDGWLIEWGGPCRGDVVIFRSPTDGKRLVKRVAGLPGDEIAGIAVPSGYYHLLGDNAPYSSDSREFGPVPRSAIIGRVVMINGD